MSDEFEDAIARLAESVGSDALEPASDEHARWDLYRRALASDGGRALVLETLRLEPNLPLASATAVRALEFVHAGERAQWIESLSREPHFDYARRRGVELEILERLRNDSDVQISDADVAEWTNWLQRQVVDECRRLDGLAVLEHAGATKYVRRRAQERVSQLGRT